MSTIPSSDYNSLQQATRQQLLDATAFNHRELFCMNAKVVSGEVYTVNGVCYTHAGSRNESMIAFPQLTAQNAGTTLDTIMAYYLSHPPMGVGCWSLDPAQPADLGVKLLARGFQPGWRPQWMSLDLAFIPTDYPVPKYLEIKADNNTPIHQVKELPYASLKDSGVNQAVLNAFPHHTQRFIAVLNGRIVGQSAVLLAAGVAGIYNVGVVPNERDQGIGKAIVLAACAYAKEKGYHYAVLNATGRRMYEKAGFEWMGDGWTWWLKTVRLLNNPPSAEQVALAEAIGTGKGIDDIDIGSASDDNSLLHQPLTNGMSLMQLAVHCQQPVSAEWLVKQGVSYTVLDAWDLGWQERAAELLTQNPGLINMQYGDRKATLLHLAAERDDLALATLALSAKPDLQLRDYVYNSTPLEWAKHLNRGAIEKLINTF
jgi:GNAT superfamily N-acetyltransferase